MEKEEEISELNSKFSTEKENMENKVIYLENELNEANVINIIYLIR